MFSINEQNAKRQAFVDKAKAEREQREQQRIKQRQEQELSSSAIVIQRMVRRRLNKNQRLRDLRNSWDIDSGVSIDHHHTNDNPNDSPPKNLEILSLAKL